MGPLSKRNVSSKPSAILWENIPILCFKQGLRLVRTRIMAQAHLEQYDPYNKPKK